VLDHGAGGLGGVTPAPGAGGQAVEDLKPEIFQGTSPAVPTSSVPTSSVPTSSVPSRSDTSHKPYPAAAKPRRLSMMVSVISAGESIAPSNRNLRTSGVSQ
jgi:hypothetical protein